MQTHQPVGTPPAEHAIDAALVAGLLAEQHPDLGHLAPREVEAGWDNAMFRLGDDLAVRLPRRLAAAELIVNEQRWLPGLAAQLPIAIPAPLRTGAPGRGYPWRWSVQPWLAGAPADQRPPEAGQAAALAGFLRALHTPAPSDAPANPVRGVPLSQRQAAVEQRAQRLDEAGLGLSAALRQIWEDALAAPIDVAPTWLHGDLHARNVLVERGAISAVIDWGDITAGDAATDLASVWMLFEDAAARRAALEDYGVSDATLRRARGWAVLLGVMLLDSGRVDNPRNAAIGAAALRRVAEDA